PDELDALGRAPCPPAIFRTVRFRPNPLKRSGLRAGCKDPATSVPGDHPETGPSEFPGGAVADQIRSGRTPACIRAPPIALHFLEMTDTARRRAPRRRL